MAQTQDDGGVAAQSAHARPDKNNDSVPKVDIHHVGERLHKEALYEKGIASYYSQKAHGHRTASGETHNKNAMVCAHRKLPFGTLLKVVNEKNGKNVVVKVNDRGPFGRGRIVDLSYGAAKELGMLADGVVQVSLYVLE